MGITIINNTDMIKKGFKTAIKKALTEAGGKAENKAKHLVPVDRGILRANITFQVDIKNDKVQMGVLKTTKDGKFLKYAPYVEFGTGLQAESGKGANIPGQKPQPYLRPALKEVQKEMPEILAKHLKGLGK